MTVVHIRNCKVSVKRKGQLSVNQPSKILEVGQSKTKVLVFDGFLSSCDPVIDFATKNTEFTQNEDNAFPGLKSKIPSDLATLMLNRVFPSVCKHYGVKPNSRIIPEAAFFGLVCKEEKELDANQSRPHFDTLTENSFALLLYLNEGPFGGTGFFRHLPTGIELVSHENKHQYFKSVDRFIEQNGVPRGYDMTAQNHYELLTEVDYRRNRALIYPSNLLHSGLIDPGTDLDDNPGTGRLTCSLFLRFEN